MYTAHVLTEQSRNALALQFPPKYEKFVGHHITEQFGVPADSEIPEAAEVVVRGIVDSGDGLEALVVTVDGEYKRPAGGQYHITWSLDPSKYAPKDSNGLIENTYRSKLTLPIPIETEPKLLG